MELRSWPVIIAVFLRPFGGGEGGTGGVSWKQPPPPAAAGQGGECHRALDENENGSSRIVIASRISAAKQIPCLRRVCDSLL